MSELFPEDETWEGGNIYGKYPLFDYKATSDPDKLYHHQFMKLDDRKEFLLDMIKEVTNQITNRYLSLITRE